MSKGQERRRYFRINEVVGLSVRVMDKTTPETTAETFAPDIIKLISENDEKIEKLLLNIQVKHPELSELVGLLNQKLERVASLVAMENQLLERVAQRVQEVNISACGIAFSFDEALPAHTRLQLELTLFPGEEKLFLLGSVISCEPQREKKDGHYYCRVDFHGMNHDVQEKLIQHIVRSQSAQLQSRKRQ